jgi:hypothetical protein
MMKKMRWPIVIVVLVVAIVVASRFEIHTAYEEDRGTTVRTVRNVVAPWSSERWENASFDWVPPSYSTSAYWSVGMARCFGLEVLMGEVLIGNIDEKPNNTSEHIP